MRVGVRVRHTLRKAGIESLLCNLALPEAWTEDFCASEACESLRGALKALGVAVSSHALVMPYYRCTLQDVLRTGAPPGRAAPGGDGPEQGASGYAVLHGLAPADRERCVAGVAAQVAAGLRALHAAGLAHLDINPSNILMRDGRGAVDVAVGDFGGLNAAPGMHFAGDSQAIPMGSLYYRSPEQRTFFDVCGVTVSASDDGSLLWLRTLDGRLLDSLIESGDVVAFSTDPARQGYSVIDIRHSARSSSVTVYNHAPGTRPAGRAEAYFYKVSTARTDLFGIGALMFDMLTLGRSPERFYDHLRQFEGRGGVSVDVIAEEYAAAARGTASARFERVFGMIRERSLGHFPSPRFVAVLLRCMMGHSSGSYFANVPRGATRERNGALFAAVLGDLEAIRDPASARPPANGRPAPIAVTDPIWGGDRLPG